MKLLIPLALTFLVGSLAEAQSLADPICAHDEADPDAANMGSLTGAIGPYGHYRALVVLVQFQDDKTVNANFQGWPASAVATPTFATGFLDPSSDPTTFRDSTLTRYLYDQSVQPDGRAFTFYGDVYPQVIKTRHDEEYYYNVDLTQCAAAGSTCPHRTQGGWGFLTKEILGRLDSLGVDFSQYDQGGPKAFLTA